jgi:hypothetical protein
MSAVNLILVGALIGLLVGHVLHAATVRFRDDPDSLWQRYLLLLLFLLSGTASWATTARLRIRQDESGGATSELVFGCVALAVALGCGFFAGLLCMAPPLTADKKKVARLILLLLGGLVLTFAGILWFAWSRDAAITLVVVTLVGFLLGLGGRTFGWRRSYATLLDLLLRPSVHSVLVSAFVGAGLGVSFLAPQVLVGSAFANFFLPASLVGAVFGWLYPRRHAVPYQDVAKLVSQLDWFRGLNRRATAPEEQLSEEEVRLLVFAMVVERAHALLSEGERKKLEHAWVKVGKLKDRPDPASAAV